MSVKDMVLLEQRRAVVAARAVVFAADASGAQLLVCEPRSL